MAITHPRLLELLHYDPVSGIFVHRRMSGRARPGARAGSVMGTGYRKTNIDGEAVLEHRLAWFYVHGVWPEIIDHINGNRADNRIANLRDVPQSVNSRNLQRPKKNNRSGVLGVTRRSENLWRVCITVGSKSRHIGYFRSPEDASAAYAKAALDANREICQDRPQIRSSIR